MEKSEILIAAKTDAGKCRANNEDAISFKQFDNDKAFALVADGMGGHRAGEVASALACKQLHIQLQKIDWNEDAIVSTIEQINQSIYTAAQENSEYQGMGTTLILACIEASQLLLAHVGDSRCYQFANDILKPLTRDHSLIEEMLDQGLIEKEDLGKSMRKNLLTRALGVANTIDISVSLSQLDGHGLLLLCSDGLSDMLDDKQIKQLLSTPDSLENMCQHFVDAANKAGGRDNISVVLIQY
ncbi:MAG TPA: Stp1/IreP family PP2C-type Ser/Thr phosphatase [Aeromonadales bacterium]|nr:Stp1/IreP family PP2C-type Ser/Thr phosphatase [Aeromonadales bacterium]